MLHVARARLYLDEPDKSSTLRHDQYMGPSRQMLLVGRATPVPPAPRLKRAPHARYCRRHPSMPPDSLSLYPVSYQLSSPKSSAVDKPEKGSRSHAGIGVVGVADYTGFMDVFVSQSDVSNARQFFCLGRIRIAGFFDFAPALRGVVAIRKPPLGFEKSNRRLRQFVFGRWRLVQPTQKRENQNEAHQTSSP